MKDILSPQKQILGAMASQPPNSLWRSHALKTHYYDRQLNNYTLGVKDRIMFCEHYFFWHQTRLPTSVIGGHSRPSSYFFSARRVCRHN